MPAKKFVNPNRTFELNMLQKEKKIDPEVRSRKRIKLILSLLLMANVGILFKLYKLQIVQHKEITEKSERQYTRTVYSQPRRGMIYDRNGREMAADIEVDSIYAHPSEITEHDKIAKLVSETLGLNYKSVAKKLKAKKSFVWIKRQANPEKSSKLNTIDLEGLGSIKEYKRFYPKREMASRLIGFSGTDNYGLSGVEHSYNQYLRGGGRMLIVEKDAKGRRVRSIEKKSNDLKQCDIVLSIDEVIQHIAEKELRKKVLETKAKEGVAIVMNPNTGEILAMADYPPFNPNQFAKYGQENWRNKVVSNAYEPGSTFKIFLVATAIENGIGPNTRFYCENGELIVGNVAIHEASSKKFKWLTMVDILAKSSNIGAIKIGEKLKKRRFHNYISKFGFGAKTGVDLEGEATGLLRDLKNWSKLSLSSVSLGQEISVTPIQLITAMSAIANGGFLLKPRVVKGIYKNGKPVKLFKPEIVRRVISRDTSRMMTAMLGKVVKKGTGKKARLNGYSVVGKTGTAQKFDKKEKTYSKSKYVASFAGYFPAEDPQLAILVMVDEPKTTFWGGAVAAPVFREIARQSARYLSIPSKQGKVIWVNRSNPDLEENFSEGFSEKKDKWFFEENDIFITKISNAIKNFKNSPRYFNDMQTQNNL